MSLYLTGLGVKRQLLDWSKLSFGERLRRAREGAGLTQERLAEKIGVEQEQISKYETDKTKPQSDRLAPIAEAIGDVAYITWLLSGRGPIPPVTKPKGAHQKTKRAPGKEA